MTRARRIMLSLLVLGLAGAAVGFATYGAFGAMTANGGNRFDAGSVAISDNDLGAALLTLPADSRPGAADSGCVTVTYDGSLASTVRLYAAVTSSGSSLAPYLSLTVTRGSGGTPDDCAAFSADGDDYGHGPGGVLFQGKLSEFPGDYASGVADPAGAWATSESHTYRFDVVLDDDAAAQGLNASAELFWEARSQ